MLPEIAQEIMEPMTWECESEPDVWVAYSDTLCAQLEAEFQARDVDAVAFVSLIQSSSVQLHTKLSACQSASDDISACADDRMMIKALPSEFTSTA